MSSTLTGKPVAGRRIEFTYYRDLKLPDPPAHPGIITDLMLNQGGCVKVRLDGERSTLHIPANYQGLRYLDEVVVPVPELPMGRFIPVASDTNGFYDKEDVLLATIGEDGEDLVLITTDRAKAISAAIAYLNEMEVDTQYVRFEAIEAYWAVFEWQPEDSECPWSVAWPATEADDQALHIYYLPA